MSGSVDEQRRVAAIRAAQRAAEAQRYELEVRRLREELVERPSGPELGIDTGWAERAEAPDAPPVPHAMLQSSLRQAIDGESWEAESASAAALEPGTPQALPGSAPKPTPTPTPPPKSAPMPKSMPQSMPTPTPKPAPTPTPMLKAEPPQAASPGLARHPDLPPTTSNEAALAFDIGMQEMAQPPAPPIDSPDDLPRDEAPVAVAAAPVDEAIVPERDPQVPLPSRMPAPPRMPAPRQQSVPVDAQPPTVPMPTPHEVAAVFDAGAREMTAQSAPPPVPVAPPVPPRDHVPKAVQRSDDPTPAPAPMQTPMPTPTPTPNEVAAAFDAGAREMASPQARPPMPPTPVQVEAPAPPPSVSEPRQPPPTPTPTPTPTPSPIPQPPAHSQPPAQPQPQPSAQPRLAAPPQQPPQPPRDTARDFDAGVREMASPPPRPSTPPPPPHAEAPRGEPDEPRADASEPDRDDDDERQSAQLALDAHLAQLTFKGIVTQGGG